MQTLAFALQNAAVKGLYMPDRNRSLSHWLEYIANIHVSAIDMGLDRVRVAFDKLSVKPPSVVFAVAGTNGKGSTSAAIAHLCQAAGKKTALYQSPHLISFNERVRINGDPVDDETLVDAFERIERARQDCQISLSFFEFTTLAAFLIFTDQKCDVWTLEIGLGGRLDVVNLIDPSVCVITNVAVDHCDWLGDTREAIGYEKAGILRKNGLLIYGEADMPQSVRQAIDAQNATCLQYGRDYLCDKSDDGWIYSAQAVTLAFADLHIAPQNAACAVTAVLASPLGVDRPSLQSLANLRLEGRFDRRVVRDRVWIFDVAHNEAGAQFLAAQYEAFWQQHKKTHPNARAHVVFSMLADKDAEAVLQVFANSPIADAQWHIAALDNARAQSVDRLRDLASKRFARVRRHNRIHDACLAAQTCALGDVILCFGSFYTVAESMNALELYRDFRPVDQT